VECGERGVRVRRRGLRTGCHHLSLPPGINVTDCPPALTPRGAIAWHDKVYLTPFHQYVDYLTVIDTNDDSVTYFDLDDLWANGDHASGSRRRNAGSIYFDADAWSKYAGGAALGNTLVFCPGNSNHYALFFPLNNTLSKVYIDQNTHWGELDSPPIPTPHLVYHPDPDKRLIPVPMHRHLGPAPQ
jgi:hypothetical protein